MRKFIVAILLTLVLCLTACGPTSGTVYAKDFIPQHQESYQVQNSSYHYGYSYRGKYELYYGPDGTYHTEYRTEPDCWWIGFQNDDGDKGSDCIGKTRWETIEIGDYYEKG